METRGRECEYRTSVARCTRTNIDLLESRASRTSRAGRLGFRSFKHLAYVAFWALGISMLIMSMSLVYRYEGSVVSAAGGNLRDDTLAGAKDVGTSSSSSSSSSSSATSTKPRSSSSSASSSSSSSSSSTSSTSSTSSSNPDSMESLVERAVEKQLAALALGEDGSFEREFLPVKQLLQTDKKRILVTGGSGFVGSHLVDALMAQGHDVYVLDNLFTGRKQNIRHWIGHPNFDFMNHDVIEPKSELPEL